MQVLEQEGITSGELMDLRLKEEEEPVRSSMKFARKNSMRNKPCGCGSGKKFKRCCWNKFNGVTL